MKFINKQNNKNYFYIFNDFFINQLLDNYSVFDYDKLFVKNRKNTVFSRPGVITNINKISVKRDNNLSNFSKYLNLSIKKGKKNLFFKHLNIAVENIYYVLSNDLNDFSYYKNYQNFVYYINNHPKYSDFNYLLYHIIFDLESIFEIKTKKNNNSKTKSKYLHEISYIPKNKRLKYVLKSLCFYKESFKNYILWERVFWSIFISILNKQNSFIFNKRRFIYLKSIKFFKKK